MMRWRNEPGRRVSAPVPPPSHPSAEMVLAECRRYEDDAHRRLADLDQKASFVVGSSLTLLVLTAGAFARAAGNKAMLAHPHLWWASMVAFVIATGLATTAAGRALAALKPTTVRYVTDEALGGLTSPLAMSADLYETAGRLAETALGNGRAAHNVATTKADKVSPAAQLLLGATAFAPVIGVLVAAAEYLER